MENIVPNEKVNYSTFAIIGFFISTITFIIFLILGFIFSFKSYSTTQGGQVMAPTMLFTQYLSVLIPTSIILNLVGLIQCFSKNKKGKKISVIGLLLNIIIVIFLLYPIILILGFRP